MWSKIDNIDNAGERIKIKNLLKKFDETKAQEILEKIKPSVEYFSNRHPIQRMDKRNANRPYEGNESEGCKWRDLLRNKNSPALDRINAMGQILYLVRSNLVHGSKKESGDDHEIIKNSIEPLRVFLEEAISLTSQLYPGER